jgi:hypothetical protein
MESSVKDKHVLWGYLLKKTEQMFAIFQEEFVAPVVLYDKRDHTYMKLPYILGYVHLYCDKKTGLVCRKMLEEFNYDVKKNDTSLFHT